MIMSERRKRKPLYSLFCISNAAETRLRKEEGGKVAEMQHVYFLCNKYRGQGAEEKRNRDKLNLVMYYVQVV